jgi:hypothetical protein
VVNTEETKIVKSSSFIATVYQDEKGIKGEVMMSEEGTKKFLVTY